MSMAGKKRRLRRGGAIALATVAAGGSLIAANAIASAQTAYSPAETVDPASAIIGANSADAIDGEYLVVFEETTDTALDVGAMTNDIAEILGTDLDAVHELDLINGVVAEMSETEAAELAQSDDVAYVEQNQAVSVAEVQTDPPSWGMDRVDQTELPLSQTYEYEADGAGTTSYILDTGINLTHNEFEGRLGEGFDAIDAGDGADCHGHGTHVAGTVGGSTYGLAKQTTLVPVRVLDCGGSGSYIGVIEGIDWMVANAEGPSVANMSLGGPFSQGLNDAMASAVDAGITFAVAAGNEGEDGCLTSPASEPSVITVGATSVTDAAASWSNWGECNDLFAPGVAITSAWTEADDAESTISGTSMASPHVAGAAALYLSANPEATPAEVEEALIANATPDVVSDVNGSPNLLLYTGFIAEAPIEDDPVDE